MSFTQYITEKIVNCINLVKVGLVYVYISNTESQTYEPPHYFISLLAHLLLTMCILTIASFTFNTSVMYFVGRIVFVSWVAIIAKMVIHSVSKNYIKWGNERHG